MVIVTTSRETGNHFVSSVIRLAEFSRINLVDMATKTTEQLALIDSLGDNFGRSQQNPAENLHLQYIIWDPGSRDFFSPSNGDGTQGLAHASKCSYTELHPQLSLGILGLVFCNTLTGNTHTPQPMCTHTHTHTHTHIHTDNS
jgi:hypothetical protein